MRNCACHKDYCFKKMGVKNIHSDVSCKLENTDQKQVKFKKELKVIVAGSRDIIDYNIVKETIEKFPFTILEIVSGNAKGVDKLGEKYSREVLKKEPKIFKADWKDLSHDDARIKENKYGKYDANAGFRRDIEMTEYADALITVWNGKSTGTKHMIKEMLLRSKIVFIGDENGKSGFA